MSRRYDPKKTALAVPVAMATGSAAATTVRRMNAKVQLAPEEILRKAESVRAPPESQLDIVPQEFKTGAVAPAAAPGVSGISASGIAATIPRAVPTTTRRVKRPGVANSAVVLEAPTATAAAKPLIPAPVAFERVSKPSRVPEKIRKVLSGERLEFAKKQEENETATPYITSTTLYVPPTRKGFYNFVMNNYRDFQIRLKAPVVDMADACRKLGSAASGAVETFLYQKFVREYIRGASPYRGLLVYHGLGTGKTCSAIAAAEALFSVANKRIIVMTPFSLRPNFINELMFCGFRHFNTNNHWISQKITTTSIQIFAVNVMGIPVEFAKPGATIWIPDFNREPNFNELTDDERTAIRTQIKAIIENRIEFINYNGVSSRTLKEWACTEGHFDDAVIIIDEVHNITRLMQGKIVPYLTERSKKGGKRKVKIEPVVPGPWIPSLCSRSDVNYARGYLFYRMLISAKNSKIIGLSGTPIINFPEELGILMNIIGGYIDCIDFNSGLVDDANIQKIREIAEKNDRIDLIHFSSDRMRITLSMLKEGYLKRTEIVGENKGVHFLGVERILPDNEEWGHANETIQESWAKFVEECERVGIRGARTWSPNFTSQPILPPDGETFRNVFLGSGDTITNTNVLYKRLAGLISYVKGSKPEYMAKVNRDEIVQCPFSEYSASVYFAGRREELEADKSKNKEAGEKGGGLWDLVEVVSDNKNISSYRFKSRAACNFAFPTSIPRPFPDSKAEVAEDEVGRVEDLEVAEAMSEPEADATAAAEGVMEDDNALAEVYEKSGEETAAEAEAAVELGKTVQAGGAGAAGAEDALSDGAAAAIVTTGPVITTAISYKVRIQEALQKLYERRENFLNLDSDRSEKRLETYSPKMAAMLRRIIATPGSSLVYSQFKTLEGTGVFGIVLKANGWDEIVLRGKGETVQFDDETIGSLARGPSSNRKRFILYTGDQAENRAVILNIFNGNLAKLPPQIAMHLEPYKESGNLHGEICKVFAISSAGAEGISLKNVRSVHIMEPYWNNARLDQVKGRAIRICSHADLPLNERNVDIYTYCAVYPRDEKDKVTGKDLIDFTTAAADGGKTTDEFILNISKRKEKISNGLLTIMKEASVDCFLNSVDNDTNLACFKISPASGKTTEPLYHPHLAEDIGNTSTEYGLERAPRESVADAKVTIGPDDAVALPDLTEGVGGTEEAVSTAVSATVVSKIPVKKEFVRQKRQELPLIRINGKDYLVRERSGSAGTMYELLEPVVDNPRVLGTVTKDILSGAIGLEQILRDPLTDIVIY